MASLSILNDYSADPKDRAAEAVYQLALLNLSKTNNEMIIPSSVANFIGDDNLAKLRDRFATARNRSIRVIHDKEIESLRFISSPRVRLDLDFGTHQEISTQVHMAVRQGDAKIPVSNPHVPRPPNSFILYRQHLHQEVTDANPGVPNTEISRIIADKWHNESPEVREHFKQLADQMKLRHAELHPNYRYSPRRPNEIARRTRLNAGTVGFIAQTPEGVRRLNDSLNTNGIIWDLDTQFLDILNDCDLSRGPQGVAPTPVSVYDGFERLVGEQVQRRPGEEIRFLPLSGNEFAPDFDMQSLLNLPGAS